MHGRLKTCPPAGHAVTLTLLTGVLLLWHHDRQLHVVERCELGLYSFFKLLVIVSHTFITPSWLECIANSPSGEISSGEVSILNTWVFLRMRQFCFRLVKIFLEFVNSELNLYNKLYNGT